jgi:hypothetical protein
MAGISHLSHRAPMQANTELNQWFNGIPADFSGITANPRVENFFEGHVDSLEWRDPAL